MSNGLNDLNTAEPLDVLVIGGGIVGAGVARDAAMRGLRTALVERRDFASGTSSRSSRLLHGGLRYLAQGRVGLVREASTEKMTLARIAPHLAQPLPFIFPTYRGSQWKRWKLRIGVKIYDVLCGKSNLGASSGLSPAETAAALPGVRTEGLTGAVRYFDGLTNDARLVLDTLRSAAAHGARLFNYVSLVSADFRDGSWHCVLEDVETRERVACRSRVVVNAAGAWAETFPQSHVRLRLTKGVHLVIDRSRLPVPDAVVMTVGSRILFAIPWGERVILGTTDTDHAGPAADEPACDTDDAAYVLKVVNEAFPHARLTDADVISAWAGLRPLIADPNGKPSDISRAHSIRHHADGWIDVAGGKLTTYRLMAEQTVDLAQKVMGRTKVPSATADRPLVPPADVVGGVLPPEVTADVVRHYCRHEWARHLDDVMIRRTGWRFYHRDQADVARRVTAWMAESLGWDETQTRAELDRYLAMTRTLAPNWQPLPSPGELAQATSLPVNAA